MDPLPPAPGVPRPLFPLAEPRRKFSWRDFFIGVSAGIVVAIVGAALLLTGLVVLANRMSTDTANRLEELRLPAPRLPPAGRLAAYGQADMSWTVETLDGHSQPLSDYRGKVIFLNIWATWCGPCIAEMSSIQKLHDRLNGENVAFVLVSDESADTIQRFLQEKPLTLPVFRSPGGPPLLFRTVAIPATFVIDPSGLVVFREIGASRWNDERAVAFLHRLLAHAP